MDRTDKIAIFGFITETLVVYGIARAFGATFVEACHATVAVNMLITICFLVAIAVNMSKRNRL